MQKTSRTLKITIFALLTVVLLMAAISSIQLAKAQATDTVTFNTSIGGTVTLPDGNTAAAGATESYTDGTTQSFTAVPGTGFVFTEWIVASGAGGYVVTDNPLSLTLNESAYTTYISSGCYHSNI
jgi:hypothetical protein